MRGLVRMLSLVLLMCGVVAVGQVSVAPAAPACACGAAPTREGRTVQGETALITWDGHRQVTDMVMHLNGSTADAAWIMPTPQDAELALGDSAVWTRIASATMPRYVHRPDWRPRFDFTRGWRSGETAASAPAGARVEKVVQVGPFQVTTLSGDASSVNGWLTDNGFPGRPELVPAFQQYLDQGWRIQAVRLVPQRAGETFSQGLPPLRMGFAADRIVYPIRLSRHAGARQHVDLHVAAPHRVAITQQASPAQPAELRDARWVPSGVVGLDHGLGAGEADGRVFLTSFGGVLTPDQISSDFELAPAPDDNEFVREVIVEDESAGRLLGAVIVLGGGLLFLGIAVTMLLRARRRNRATS